ncbi:hypothetical protein [Sphingobium sp.]|uniref:hypothetical protein n=1 Tax=Sphingobium sp. TaxID=1912891 RepID=UPI003BB52F43
MKFEDHSSGKAVEAIAPDVTALTPAVRRDLAKVKALSEELFRSNEGLVKDRRGGVAIAWAAGRMRMNVNSAWASPVKEEIRALAKKHPFENETIVESHVAAIRSLSDRLARENIPLKRGHNGAPSRSWACRLAGLRENTWTRHPAVEAAIIALAEVHPFEDRPASHLFEGFEEPVSGSPDVDPEDTRIWLETLNGDTANLSTGSVDQTLAGLVGMSRRLSIASKPVPARNGQPMVGQIARDLCVDVRTFSHPAVVEMIERLVRRHGTSSPAASAPRDDYSRARLAVFDLALSHRARLETFERHSNGAPLVPVILMQAGLSAELAYHTAFREHIVETDAWLAAEIGVDVAAGTAMNDAVAAVVLDEYRMDVRTGAATPPRPGFDAPTRKRLERALGFVTGSLCGSPLLIELEDIARCFWASVDHEGQFCARERRAAFIAESIAALSSEGRRLRVNLAGGISNRALEQSLRRRVGDISKHPLVAGAISDLAATVGTEAKQSTGTQKVDGDRAVDAYCKEIVDRGYGHPREFHLSDCLAKEATAVEIGIPVAHLTQRYIRLISAASRSVSKRGPVRPSQPKPPLNEIDIKRADFLRRRLLAEFPNGLPENPLSAGDLDLHLISETVGISVQVLRLHHALRAVLDDLREELRVIPYTGLESGITFRQLRTFGRRRRSKQAVRDQQPSRAATRTAIALDDLRDALGRAPHDEVGNSLFSDRIPSPVPAEIKRWRSFHCEMILERNPGISLARGLRMLCRALGISDKELHEKVNEKAKCDRKKAQDVDQTEDCPPIVTTWVRGDSIPNWTDEPILEMLNRFFDLDDGRLASLLNPDFRPLGRPCGSRRIDHHIMVHLPYDFYLISDPDERLRIEAEVATAWAVQNTAYSRRIRVLSNNEYKLPFDLWPRHLKAEFRKFMKGKKNVGSGADRVPHDLYAPIPEEGEGSGLVGRGVGRFRDLFESFFGFATLAPTLSKPTQLVHKVPDPHLAEARTKVSEAVGYVSQGGLGVPRSLLSIGMLGFPAIVGEYDQFRKNRSGAFNSETVEFHKVCQEITRPKRAVAPKYRIEPAGMLRTHAAIRTATVRFANWWTTHQTPEMRSRIRIGAEGLEEATLDALCDSAIVQHDVAYGRLLTLRMGRFQGKPLQTRNPFEAIQVVVNSTTPVAVYRAAIQRMIKNRPMDARNRNLHDRDCLMMLLLFQTHFRIKNIAQLTYKADGTGQLFERKGRWIIRIHRDRFKNRGGGHFKDGDFYELELRDEDGLYKLIRRYLDVARPNLAMTDFAPKRPSRNWTSEAEWVADIDENDDLHGQINPEEDEEGDSYEDDDRDGESPESRVFVTRGGHEFLPSSLAGRFKYVTARYLSESPFRRRGLMRLMSHGPHSLRHIAATDVLAQGGTWEEAAETLLDSVTTIRKTYVNFTPSAIGRRNAKKGAAGRDVAPVFMDKSGFHDLPLTS